MLNDTSISLNDTRAPLNPPPVLTNYTRHPEKRAASPQDSVLQTRQTPNSQPGVLSGAQAPRLPLVVWYVGFSCAGAAKAHVMSRCFFSASAGNDLSLNTDFLLISKEWPQFLGEQHPAQLTAPGSAPLSSPAPFQIFEGRPSASRQRKGIALILWGQSSHVSRFGEGRNILKAAQSIVLILRV